MMRDPITDAAQDPSCLLCLTPDRGGSWWSRLHPHTPRNFKKTGDVSWTWTGFSAASNVIGSDDFEFEVIYRLNALQNPNYIFYHSDTRGSVNVGFTESGDVYLTMGRVRNPETGTRKNAGAIKSDFAEFSAIGEWVSVVIRRVSGALSLILNGRTTNTTAVDQTDVWYSDLDPISNFDGNMRSAKLVNLTTGGTVWSASRAELYETQNPWPSSVPRNFAEETKTWYDFQNMQLAADWTHDYTFECTFMLHTRDNPAPVLYVNASSQMFGVYQYRDNTIGLFTTLCRQAASAGKYLAYIITAENATIFWESYHTVKIVVNGNSTSFYIDNELIRTFSSNYERTPKVDLNLATPTTKTGYIGNCFIQDDTTGKIVWSYPSEAERVRLITKTNVRTDRGAFEAVDEMKPARVDTALDLRGKVSSYTVVVDFEAIAPDGTQSKMELAGQGASVSSDFPSICALAQSGNTGNIQLSQEINGSRKIVYKAPNNQLGRHVAVGVVDVGNSSTRLAVYYDGDLLVEDTFNGLPAGTCDPKAVNWAIFDNRNGANTMRYGKIYSALLFDRALSAAEIAALTPKQSYLWRNQ